MSNTSSIPQELIMQEVRNQVREAMREKDAEMNELRGQNRELKNALQDSLKALESMRGDGEDQGQELPPGVPAELRGNEPEVRSGQGGQSHLHDPPGRRLLQEQLVGGLPGSGLAGTNVSGRGGDPAGLHRGEGGKPSKAAQGADGAEPRRSAMEGDRGDAEDPLHVLAQGMRQLQLAYMGKSDKDSGKCR